MNKVIQFLLCIGLTLLVGSLSGIATATGVKDWYLTINKPSFNPPNYLFGSFWTVLYLLMGISLYLVLQSTDRLLKKRALIIFCIQISLNFLWSFFFFKFHMIGLALIDIIGIWLLIVGMIPAFYKINKVAGLIQFPYLCWVSFAGVLNAAIYTLN
jgi:tryptophan-rich sensory protein